MPALPLPEQKAIASILGALDDKIELNRKMNETLEAMARAIFKSWVAPKGIPELDVLIKGIFEKKRILDLLRYFIVFEVDGAKITKKMAAYHQFHAVNKAVECTLAGCGFQTSPCSGRQTYWCGLAYPGERAEPDHGLLCRDWAC